MERDAGFCDSFHFLLYIFLFPIFSSRHFFSPVPTPHFLGKIWEPVAEVNMFNMDFASKSMDWVGNMYQKLETICTDFCEEIDGLLAQESARGIEPQVQEVGVNGQISCSEVVQDFHSPSSLHSPKGAVSDLSHIDVEMSKNSGHIKEEPSPAADEVEVPNAMENSSLGSLPSEFRDENHGEQCTILLKKLNSIPAEVAGSSCLKKAVGSCDTVQNEVKLSDNLCSLLSNPALADPVVSHKSSCALSTDITGASVTLSTLESSVEAEIDGSGVFDQNDDSEANNGCNLNMESMEEFEDLILMKSFMNAEDIGVSNEHSLVSCQRITNTSDKKLGDVLVSKLQLAKKCDCRKCKILYAAIVDKDSEGNSPYSTPPNDTDFKTPSTQDICESEWEFL